MNRDLQSKEIFDPVFSKAVPRYIAHCQKSKQKYEKLYPKCVEIFAMEIKNVEWMDECFAKIAMDKLKGAHVSQLSSFYCRYNHSAKKTVFFSRWLRDEL